MLYIASGRTGRPLIDADLARFDRAIFGIDQAALVTWTKAHHSIEWCSIHAYGLLGYFFGAALILPALFHVRRAKSFLLAGILGLFLAMATEALFPGIGPWFSEHFTPYGVQAMEEHQILALRSPAHFPLDLATNAGIITFPSFHVALSIMAAYALWPFRWVRIPVALLAALISISTITTGWHYVSDVAAGIVCAVLAIRASRSLLDIIERKR